MASPSPFRGAVNALDYLHKLSSTRKMPAPQFSQLSEQGPPHLKTFVWECKFHSIVARGQGKSKKEAKIAAARAVKDQLANVELPECKNNFKYFYFHNFGKL